MRRRNVLLAAMYAAAWSATAVAQSKVWRVGILETATAELNRANLEEFNKRLRELGYIEGQNLVTLYRAADGNERLATLVAEVIAFKPDLIVVRGTPEVVAVKNATGSLPVIFVAGIDPITLGLASRGLAHGGANITGLTTVQIDLTAKRMQLLKEMLPSLTSVAFLVRESNPGSAQYVREAQDAAKALSIGLHLMAVRNPGDFESAFRNALALGAGGVVPMDDAAFTSARRQLIELAERYGVPGVYPIREFVSEGGLISLGPKYEEVYRRGATYVDKVLKGTDPADLPVEQPTTFEVVINLKTAKALGLTIPPTLLARADEVIE